MRSKSSKGKTDHLRWFAPLAVGIIMVALALVLVLVLVLVLAWPGLAWPGLAFQILQAGIQLNIPLMFAALLLIALTGVSLFLLMTLLTRKALKGWHESEL